jgi:hypothetical protein
MTTGEKNIFAVCRDDVRLMPRDNREQVKIELDPKQPVFVSVLGSAGSVETAASIVSIAGKKMLLASELRLEAGTPVRVRCSPYVVLAETQSHNEADHQLILLIRHVVRDEDIEEIRSRWI